MPDKNRKDVLEYTGGDLLDVLWRAFESKGIRSVETKTVKTRIARGGVPVYIIE